MQKSIFLSLFMLLGAWRTMAQSSWMLANQAQGNNYYRIYAINPDKVVVCGEQGILFQSNNGAQTMQPYQLEDNFSIFNEVDFLNAQIGFAGGGCYFPTTECVDHVLATTTNGGQSWTWERIAIGVGVLSKLEVMPDGTLFALGDFTGIFRRNPSSTVWDSLGHPNNIQPNGYLGMQFLDANHGFVENWTVVNGQYISHLFRTADGGQNWTEIYAGSNPGLRAMHYFLDTQRGFQLTSTGQLGRTTDGGANWAYEQVFDHNELMLKIDFVTPDVGYLSTRDKQTQTGRLYRSTDAGAHWELDFQRDSMSFFDFHFADPEQGYVLGNFQSIFKRKGSVPSLEPLADLGLRISPNPVRAFARVELPARRDYHTLVVYDCLGREMQRIVLAEGQLELRILVDSLMPGVYFVAPLGHLSPRSKFVVAP